MSTNYDLIENPILTFYSTWSSAQEILRKLDTETATKPENSSIPTYYTIMMEGIIANIKDLLSNLGKTPPITPTSLAGLKPWIKSVKAMYTYVSDKIMTPLSNNYWLIQKTMPSYGMSFSETLSMAKLDPRLATAAIAIETIIDTYFKNSSMQPAIATSNLNQLMTTPEQAVYAGFQKVIEFLEKIRPNHPITSTNNVLTIKRVNDPYILDYSPNHPSIISYTVAADKVDGLPPPATVALDFTPNGATGYWTCDSGEINYVNIRVPALGGMVIELNIGDTVSNIDVNDRTTYTWQISSVHLGIIDLHEPWGDGQFHSRRIDAATIELNWQPGPGDQSLKVQVKSVVGVPTWDTFAVRPVVYDSSSALSTDGFVWVRRRNGLDADDFTDMYLRDGTHYEEVFGSLDCVNKYTSDGLNFFEIFEEIFSDASESWKLIIMFASRDADWIRKYATVLAGVNVRAAGSIAAFLSKPTYWWIFANGATSNIYASFHGELLRDMVYLTARFECDASFRTFVLSRVYPR